MTKHLTRAAFVAALAIGASAPALAQSVLVIDLDRVYSDSAAAKAATTQMQARYAGPSQQAQAAFNAARTSYESQLAAAQKVVGASGDASKLPPATRQALGAAQDRLEEARQQALQVQQAVQSSGAYVRDQINQQLLPIAEQVRAERKAAIVIPRGGLLASDTAVDITSVVLPRLDQRVTTVPIVPPQQTAPATAPSAATPAPAGPRPQQGR